MLGLVTLIVVSKSTQVWICSPNLEHEDPVSCYGTDAQKVLNNIMMFDTREQAQEFADKQHNNYVQSKIAIAGRTNGTIRGEGRKVIAELQSLVAVRRWIISSSTVRKRW